MSATLYHGDCLTILPSLEAESIDAIVTDPPYGILNRFGIQRKLNGLRRLQFDWDGPTVVRLVTDALHMSLLKCRPAAALFVFTSIDLVGALLPIAREAGFTVKPAVWVKKCPPPALKGNWWPSAFELAFYGYRGGAFFADTDTKRRNVFVADSYRHGQPGKVAHPTQKPLGLMRHIIQSIVPPGGRCLDPFAGSGTTGVGCVETGRDFIGIEINRDYFKIAKQRLSRCETIKENK